MDDESVMKIVKNKPRPSKKDITFSSFLTVDNCRDESPRHDDDWDNFVSVHSPSSSQHSDLDEFKQSIHLQSIVKALTGDNDIDVGHISQQQQHHSQTYSSRSGRTPRGGFLTPRGIGPLLSFRKRTFSTTSLHPSSPSLEIIEDDQELDVSRKAKGTFRSLGSYLSLVTMKAMPRLTFGKPKKIGIDGDDLCENMEVLDVSAHTGVSLPPKYSQHGGDIIMNLPTTAPMNHRLPNHDKLSANAFLLFTTNSTTPTACPSLIASPVSTLRIAQKEVVEQ